MKLSHETKIGIFSVLGITILVIGYTFLTGKNFFSKKKYYYAVFPKTDGLNTNDKITVNGLSVGEVAGLDLLNHTNGKILARLVLEKDLKIPENSVFQLYSSDLLGEKAVQLQLGDSKEFAKAGDTLAGVIQPGLLETVGSEFNSSKLFMGSAYDSIMQAVRIIIEEHHRDVEKAIDTTR